jgi:NitT/TauT family transport system substrate-binding protein
MDGGFMGIPPYLIARDKGMRWTAVAAVAEARLGLATTRPEVRSLEDIPPNLRIALPQPGSIQHILLTMAAKRILGDAERFDNQLVTLNHPDGMSALLSGTEVEAHFTSPPYLQEELASDGVHLVLNGEEAFGGGFTFIVAVLSDDLIRKHPETADGIRRALSRSSEWLNGHPAEAARLLSAPYSMEADALRAILESDALEYGGEIRGMDDFRVFMHSEGYLSTDMAGHDLVLR